MKTGKDAGIKAAAAGALKAASEKGLISMLPKGTLAGLIANIACVGIENCKIIARCIKGEISPLEAVDQMGRTTVSMYYGLAGAGIGAKIGATLGSVIPVAGTVVGGFIGGAIGYAAGSEFVRQFTMALRKLHRLQKPSSKPVMKPLKLPAMPLSAA